MDTTYYTTSTSTDSAGISAAWMIIYLIILVIAIVAYWRLFVKAGYAGWKVLIPIYNIYIMCKIADRPGWWTILCIIPGVNFVASAFLAVDTAKAFEKSTIFALVGMWLFGPIGQIIIGFDASTYDKSRIGRVE